MLKNDFLIVMAISLKPMYESAFSEVNNKRRYIDFNYTFYTQQTYLQSIKKTRSPKVS